jgi:hypothetical protein
MVFCNYFYPNHTCTSSETQRWEMTAYETSTTHFSAVLPCIQERRISSPSSHKNAFIMCNTMAPTSKQSRKQQSLDSTSPENSLVIFQKNFQCYHQNKIFNVYIFMSNDNFTLGRKINWSNQSKGHVLKSTRKVPDNFELFSVKAVGVDTLKEWAWWVCATPQGSVPYLV